MNIFNTLMTWFINETTFSYPIGILLCFQIAKLITVSLEKRGNILFSTFRYMGGDLCIICIPILIASWGNQSTELYKQFGQHNPVAVGYLTVFLGVISILCIWLGHLANTTPEDQKIAKALSNIIFKKFLKTNNEKHREYFKIFCGSLRKANYALIAFLIGFIIIFFLFNFK